MSRRQKKLSPAAVWARALLRYLVRRFVVVDVQGDLSALELGALGRVIITNHIHRTDFIMVQSVISEPVFFVLAHDVCPGKPFMSLIIRRLAVSLGGIVVHRNGRSNKEAIQAMLRLLASGQAVLLAPEGDKSQTGELGKGKGGAALLATMAQVPVVPVVTYGYESLGPSFRSGRKPVIHIRVGPPIHPPAYKRPTLKDQHWLTNELMYHLAELLPIAMRGEFNLQPSD